MKMEPIVQLPDGQIKGAVKHNFNDEPYYSFTCIPYGKAPIGDLRFKAPEPVEPWQGVKDATKEEHFSIQRIALTGQIAGSEDCLSLHVFTKKLANEGVKLRPVMVYIHGGGFCTGNHSTKTYGPEFLMTEDIVLVSVTYRLGIFGFAHFKDQTLNVPGNAALKDQVLALKWVERNIKNFNGDPNNVTVFGESAGGASVEYLVLSTVTKGLFQKAIIQSGSSLNPWPRSTFDAADLAKFLGKPEISERGLLNILTELSAEELYDTQLKYLQSKGLPGDMGIFGPTVEKPNPAALITKEPIDIIQSGNYNAVPVIIGYNNNEGGMFVLMELLNKAMKKDPIPLKIEIFLPYQTDFNNTELVKKLTDIIEKFYHNEENSKHKTLLQTDASFVAGIISSVKNQAKASNNPVYFYRFAVDGNLNFLKKMGNFKDHPGAFHGDELGYLFKSIVPENFGTSVPIEIGELERLTLQRMIKLWTNFAKFGNPTPEGNDLKIKWNPVETNQLNFLNIGEQLKMDVNPEAERMKVWREIYNCNPLTAKYLV